jgi:hypothetical protein
MRSSDSSFASRPHVFQERFRGFPGLEAAQGANSGHATDRLFSGLLCRALITSPLQQIGQLGDVDRKHRNSERADHRIKLNLKSTGICAAY